VRPRGSRPRRRGPRQRRRVRGRLRRRRGTRVGAHPALTNQGRRQGRAGLRARRGRRREDRRRPDALNRFWPRCASSTRRHVDRHSGTRPSCCMTCVTPATSGRSSARPTPPAPRRSCSPVSRWTPSIPRPFARAPDRSSICRSWSRRSTRHVSHFKRRRATPRDGRARRTQPPRGRLHEGERGRHRQRGRRTRRATIERCDQTISIPMDGRSESLNAGVAASLIAFEALWQRRDAGRAPPPRSL
jgi:hypothetical protein